MPPLKWLGHQLLSSFLCRMRGSCEGDNGWGFRQLRVWGEEIISILGAGGGMQDVLVSQSEAGVMCWARLTCILLPWAGTDICFSFFLPQQPQNNLLPKTGQYWAYEAPSSLFKSVSKILKSILCNSVVFFVCRCYWLENCMRWLVMVDAEIY